MRDAFLNPFRNAHWDVLQIHALPHTYAHRDCRNIATADIYRGVSARPLERPYQQAPGAISYSRGPAHPATEVVRNRGVSNSRFGNREISQVTSRELEAELNIM
jgi:hypothetical protein